MRIPQPLVLFSILSFSFFAIGTALACQDAANLPDEEGAEQLEFVRAPSLSLSSYSNQNYRLGIGNSITCSENSRLFRFLMNEEVCLELELSNEQKRSLVDLKKQYLKNEQELEVRLNQLDEVEFNGADDQTLTKGRSEIHTWNTKSSKKFAEQWKDLLLPHQLELLKEIRVNYLVAIFGHAKVLKSCADEGLFTGDPESIKQLNVAQKRLSLELNKRCQAFAKKEIEMVVNAIEDERAKITIAILEKANLTAIPELIVAQAKELENTRLKSKTKLHSIWGDRVIWELSTHGSFEGKLHRNKALAVDYIVNAFHKDKNLHSDLEISESQIEKLGEIVEEINALNAEVGELIEDCKPDSPKYQRCIKDLIAKKERLMKSRVPAVFLHFRMEAIDEWNQLVELRRFGFHFSLLNGQMGKTINVSASEKKAIRELGESAPKRYQEFASKTAKWYFEELLASVRSEEDRKQIGELFNHDFRILKLPIGCLSLTLIRNGTN